MLYDPKWKRQTKADPESVRSLVAWLETMPADGVYDYLDCAGGCLFGQYGRALGVKWDDLHTSFWRRGLLRIASDKPRTFGGALQRALALIAK